jgi:hypothetical protein
MGGAMPPGMQVPGQPPVGPDGNPTNPMNMLLKMEYEKEKHRQKLEDDRKRAEWQERVRMRNEEQRLIAEKQRVGPAPTNIMQQPQPITQTSPVQYQPETTRVTVTPPPEQPTERVDITNPGTYSVDTFMPYPVESLSDGLSEIDNKIKMMEKYKATMAAAYQEKLANGEVRKLPSATAVVQTANVPTVNNNNKEPEPDYGEVMDTLQGMRDPDYTGPEDEDEEEEKEVVDTADTKIAGEEKEEEVEI